MSQSANNGFSRRRFLVTTSTAGAGLSLGVLLPGCAQETEAPAAAAVAAAVEPAEVNAWVIVNPDSSVIIRGAATRSRR